MKRIKTSLIAFIHVLLLITLVLQIGCATIRGMGQDIQSAGEAIHNAAD